MPAFNPPDITTLPNGKLVCSEHLLRVCCICTHDFTFDEEDRSDRTDSDGYVADGEIHHSDGCIPASDDPVDLNERLRRMFASKESLGHEPGSIVRPALLFMPPRPTATPSDLFMNHFSNRGVPTLPDWRYTRKTNEYEFLAFTDGACLDNSGKRARGGCGVVLHEPLAGKPTSGQLSMRLEDQGPDGKPHVATSNRAELRAVDMLLGLRYWPGEGFESLIVASDSEYVVKGATEWSKRWIDRNWKNARGHQISNLDLWTKILKQVALFRDCGLQVCFWYIPRELNTTADALAKRGAQQKQEHSYTRMIYMPPVNVV